MGKKDYFCAMKRLIIFAAALMTLSCTKDYITPDELFNDASKMAKTTIKTRSDEYEDTVTWFPNVAVYRKSDFEGQSWLCAFSGGKMVYDAFMLSIYFDSIDQMKVGDTVKPSRFLFSFIFSSDGNATTHEYGGRIKVADKGDDYVILCFNKVSVNCSFGKYLTDGYLYCPLFEEYEY